jgi:hypothetical protein
MPEGLPFLENGGCLTELFIIFLDMYKLNRLADLYCLLIPFINESAPIQSSVTYIYLIYIIQCTFYWNQPLPNAFLHLPKVD